MLKLAPAPGYPSEEGHYLRGNDYSPVAVAVVLIYDYDKIPQEIEDLVRAGVEAGGALSGTIQTENIGLEKLVCNIVGNPNIRHLVVTGRESPGHSTGDAILKLLKNGVDERKRIIGTQAPTPYLFNLPLEHIERFRKQIITGVDLLNTGSLERLRQAVWSCYQETPTLFEGYELYDPGAYPEGPLETKLTWRVTNPVTEPKSEEERKQKDELLGRMEMIRTKMREKSGQGRP